MARPTIEEFAKDLLRRNTDKLNTPLGQELMRILDSNDTQSGEKLANNLLHTYGVSKEDGINLGKRFFNL